MSDLGFPGSGGGREGSLYALDQALNNVHSIKFKLWDDYFNAGIQIPVSLFPLPKPWELAHRLKCYTSNLAFCCLQVSVILLPVITIILSLAPHVNINMCYVLSTVYWTIIPRAQIGTESIAYEAKGLMGYWLRGHEGERNNCFSKIQLVGQKYRDKTT